MHHLVLVEDNPADTTLLRVALNEQGEAYVLEVLQDGEAALNYVRDHCRHGMTGPPCLIILDLHLPRYDGVTVLRAIKADPLLKSIHVAVLTTSASPTERDEVFALGVELYRHKPLEWGDFVKIARELLALCKQGMQAVSARA